MKPAVIYDYRDETAVAAPYPPEWYVHAKLVSDEDRRLASRRLMIAWAIVAGVLGAVVGVAGVIMWAVMR